MQNLISLVVVEDEAVALRRTLRVINAQPYLRLLGTAQSGKEALKLIPKLSPDLLILDIELKDMTSFELIEQLPNTYSGKIIFLTAYHQYAIQAFEVFAIDYILKPFDEKRLIEAIQRVQNRASNSDVYRIRENLSTLKKLDNKVEIPEGNTVHLIDTDKVLWIKAEGYHVNLFFMDQPSRLIRITLKDVLHYLPEEFIRINRSEIIHLKHVSSKTVYKNEERYKLNNGLEFIRTKKYLKND